MSGTEGSPTGTAAAPAGAGVTLEVTIDRDAVTIGDPVTLTVRLVHPADVVIDRFEPERALQEVGLLGRADPPPRTLPDGRIEQVRSLTIAAYEVGRVEIPSMEAAYTGPAGETGSAASEPVAFTVASVLAEGEMEPADIKSPASMPVAPVWPWVALAVLLLAVAAWVVWRRRGRRPAAAAPSVPAAPLRPADEVAYAELEHLLNAKLLETGRLKEFYIELAEIIRRYLAARYGVETFERTSSEILESLRVVRLSVRTTATTAEFFGACDMVKFARHSPLPEETRGTVALAYRLVDETRPVEPRAPAAPAPAVAQGGA